MNTRLLAPALGLVLLGTSALTLADDGWRHKGPHGGGHPGWHDRGRGFGPPPHWHGPVHRHYYPAPPHYGYHAYPLPRPHGYHWAPPKGPRGWGPPPHYRPSGHYPHGWNRDGITVILRGSFH